MGLALGQAPFSESNRMREGENLHEDCLIQALTLIASGDRQVGIILVTTLRMVLASSVLA